MTFVSMMFSLRTGRVDSDKWVINGPTDNDMFKVVRVCMERVRAVLSKKILGRFTPFFAECIVEKLNPVFKRVKVEG
ncbi:hypothetical protein TorRG33x02_022440 [Trema orientale]|uniref:Uncharacterized protein n=1 Tax=Trema orientale TaxID=63057 RepID=A0A2P5FVY6_TREOI|nr:hypothetical protein TorRG33x02_022440 [Trema orientale]